MKNDTQYDIDLIKWRMNLTQFSAHPFSNECFADNTLKSDVRECKQETQLFVSNRTNSVGIVLDEKFLGECWSQWKEEHNKVY